MNRAKWHEDIFSKTHRENEHKLSLMLDKFVELARFYADPELTDKDRMLVLSDKARGDLSETPHSRFTFGEKARTLLKEYEDSND